MGTTVAKKKYLTIMKLSCGLEATCNGFIVGRQLYGEKCSDEKERQQFFSNSDLKVFPILCNYTPPHV